MSVRLLFWRLWTLPWGCFEFGFELGFGALGWREVEEQGLAADWGSPTDWVDAGSGCGLRIGFSERSALPLVVAGCCWVTAAGSH